MSQCCLIGKAAVLKTVGCKSLVGSSPTIGVKQLIGTSNLFTYC